MVVSDVQFRPAKAGDRGSGLLGFVSFMYCGAFWIAGMIRRTRDGRRTLTYQARRDAYGNLHYPIRPINDTVRLEIERLVFGELGIEFEE